MEPIRSVYARDGREDALAAALSGICLIHCLLLPIGLGLAPALAAHGGLWHGPEWLHWALLALAAPFSIHALRRGIAVHGDGLPWKLAAAGFATMAAGALAHEAGLWEQGLTLAGAILLIAAHWRNWRTGRTSRRA